MKFNKMKSNAILVSFILFALLMTSLVIAATDDLEISDVEVLFDGLDVTTDEVAAQAGETVPIKIKFLADEDAQEVEVSAWIQGHRSDRTEIDFRDLIEGNRYNARLSLTMPTDIDPEEDLTLYVRMESDQGNWEEAYTIGMQREPYKANVLFVEIPQKVMAGTSVPVDVVVKNIGRHELDDLIVSVSVPELEIKRRAFFGDLNPVDECNDCDEEDSMERVIYLTIPDDTQNGVYDLEVSVYNSDTESTVTKNLLVEGSTMGSEVLAAVSTKTLSAGSETVYDLIIVNAGRGVGIYTLIPEETRGITVSLDENLVTVPGESSRVVKVNVKAASDAEEGTYNFGVNVYRGDELVERAQLSANVMGKQINSVVIASVVLAIVFIVLLIVLIVLLTRKPEKTEFEETSYY